MTHSNIFYRIASVAMLSLSILLVGCGGGGGNASAPPASAGNGTTATVADLSVGLSQLNVPTANPTDIKLSVRATDANRNGVAAVRVEVSLSDQTGGAAFTPDMSATDVSGSFTGVINSGALKANRTVTVVIAAGGIRREVTFNVTGTVLKASLVPNPLVVGGTGTLQLTLEDSVGAGIPNQQISLSGLDGIPASVRSDVGGKASVPLRSPAAPGVFRVSAVGLGATSNTDIEVLAVGGGGRPNASGPIVAASLAAVPNVIGTKDVLTNNRAALRAVFLTSGNRPLQNVRVRFSVVPGPSGAVLGGGEAISTADNQVLSDDVGTATSDYLSGSRSSPNNGVVVRACYSGQDFPVGTCPNFVDARLTVAARPLSLTLGDDNRLARLSGNLLYVKEFVLVVADSAGQPVAGAQISFTVDLFKFGKGRFSSNYPVSSVSTTGSGTSSVFVIPADDGIPNLGTGGERSWCLNEDLNRNGNRDALEDLNGNGTLEPRQADITISSVTPGNRTNSDGIMVIRVVYPQNVATWLAYTVRATAQADGSEGAVSKRYIATYIEGDDKDGSFLLPPYGTSNICSDPL